MTARRALSAIAALALAIGTGAAAAPATASASTQAGPGHSIVMSQRPRLPVRQACPAADRPGVAQCLTLIRTNVRAHLGLFRQGVTAQAAPSGYGPSDLRSAYDLPSATAGSGATVALVDAYNDPDIASDLAIYRSEYGLPGCTAASGCFRVINQHGQAKPLPPNAAATGWDVEESLDVQMVSAICPNCKIVLVEANSPAIPNLGAAEDAAVASGADYVSNSYGATDQAAETGWDKYYDHPGTVITASAGDSGYGVNYPSGSQYVTAVGGTTLTQDSSVPRGWTESVWGSASGGSGTGSGCSGYEPQPSWQAGVTSGCANRATADVSAVANPSTGVAMYDSYSEGGWIVVGGTSVASPIIASTFALAGLPATDSYPASYLYDHFRADPSAFNDVTSGANGTCTPAVLCTAGPGWDGPTGLGTPDGVTGFGYAKVGAIAGTVTDAATGDPVAGAQVSAPGLSVTTGSNGGYTLSGLPAGPYKVSVSGYGYQSQTQSVTVTANQTATQNFALAGTPHVTVSGRVTAATGTPFPLYAEVSWTDGHGHSGTAYTTPANGRYALSLLANGSYTLSVTPVYSGYTAPAARTVAVAASPVTRNFTAAVDPVACTALGYHAVLSGRTQSFGGSAVPAGWRVTNTNEHITGYHGTPGWVFDNPGGRPNDTGGSGNFAIVDSDHDGQFNYQDTELTSPATDMSSDQSPALQFGTDLQPAVNSTATVDVSTNGGKNWANVWTSQGYPGGPGPATVTIPLPQAAGQASVRVRFGYTGQWSQYWEIDNVFLGNRACVQQAGALVTGRVTGASGNAVNGATVASVANPAQHATTMATPGDPAINGGLYTLFVTGTGSQQFTASDTGYTSSTKTVTVTTDRPTTLNFTLSP
jgi:Carboxypeptidase regulatory-like domain